ncbi:MAG: hypothetical protein ACFFG0_17330 [Candidatus Thorarchaeota archaeon]
MREERKIVFNSAEKLILFTGILLIILSFICEINFHFIQGFQPELVSKDVFWKAEAAEVFNSMSYLILGIFLIIATFKILKKRIKTE